MNKLQIILLAVVLFLLSIINARLIPGKHFKTPKKLVIDTDAGADDAIALLLALRAEQFGNTELEILAITCVSGNTNIGNVVQNVLKTLTIANRNDIPVYIGTNGSLLLELQKENFFGSDGFGDFQFEKKITAVADNHTPAPLALINIVKQYPGEVSILALGPLTNIALAIELDPSFVKNVQQFYIAAATVKGIGNITPTADFNVYADPESFYIVFKSLIKPSLMVPWDITYDIGISLKWRKDVFGKLNSTAINFINQAERISVGKYPTWKPADAVTTAVTLWPQIIRQSIYTYVNVSLEGDSRGVTTEIHTNKYNAHIPTVFNVKAFKSLLLKYLACN